MILSFLRDPSGHFLRARARWGDTWTVPGIYGTIVITTDPELARVVFQAPADELDPFAPEALSPAVGEASVFALGGARHREERRLLMPPFHGERMRAYGEMMRGVARRHASRWRSDRPVVLHEALNAVSSEIIVRCVFGVSDDAAVERSAGQVRRFVDTVLPSGLFFPAVRTRWNPAWRRFTRERLRTRSLLGGEIDSRAESGERGDDILSMLLSATYEDGTSMGREALIDELMTLLLAGHETVTIAMTWALYWLERHPEHALRLDAELAGSGDDPGSAALPWLDAVCRESLRVHPVVPDVIRTLRNPLSLGPWTIPAGHSVGVGITGIHQREDLYPEPFTFRPDRFLERSYGPHEYLPFGGGVRRCVGAAFAMFEMKQVLSVLFRTFAFRRVSDRPARPVRRNVTMAPRGGVPMWVTPR